MINLPSRLCHAAVKGTEPDYGRTASGPNPPPFAEDTSDFTFVKDCAEVLTRVNAAPELQHRVYNVGGGRAFTMQDVVDSVKEMVPDAKIELRPGSSPGNSSKDAYLDLSRVKDELGFTPRYPIERGIPEYITWLRTHPQ
jgi:UDP-glucose 4-epimerase